MWIKITEQGSSELKVVWNYHLGELGSYIVNAAFLNEAAEAVRKQLDLLANTYQDSRGTAALADPQVRDVMVALAHTGDDLRFALFQAVPGTAQPPIETLKRKIQAASAADQELSVQMLAKLAIPFGLIFDGPIDDSPEALTRLLEGDGFWGRRYRISVTPSVHDVIVGPQDNVNVLALINRDEFQNATKGFKAPPPVSDVRGMLQRPIGATYSLKGFEEALLKAANTSCIVYFFGHANDQTLHVSNVETLAASKFQKNLWRLAARDGNPDSNTTSLVFLNACDTGLSRLGADFFSAINQEGICGLIASEAKLPARFAIRYAHDLFHELLEQGTAVGKAMAELGVRYWPYSALYSCHANPYYAVEPRQKIPA